MDNDKYIGRLLDNRYEILEVIGIGGMAVVYKARCHRLNRLVAIKILKDEFSKDEDFRRRFHAEGQAVAMVSHPNIVAVYDVSSTGESDYIVMELIDGISLKQYMEKKGVLNWKETLHFGIQISKALEHAHSRGIVHRDIKPHNVMVLKNGSVKVADFGIARVMSQGNTLTKEALGSVHYISPEQAKGGRVDDRSDIYSLGTVMYEMMTGRPPYDGESPVAVAIQHINGGAKMPSTINPNIPGGMEQIIMKAMAHDPADRYASATAMLYDMDEFRKNPTILFDYNIPPTDAVIRLQPNPEQNRTPRSTAQRVAASADAAAQRRRNTSGMSSAEQRSEARRAQRSTTNTRRPEPPKRRKDAYEDEDRSNAATIAIIVCSAVAIIAIVIFLIALFGNGAGSDDGLVSVPTLVGKYQDALPQFTDLVLADPQLEYSAEYEKGQVMRQEPKPGERVAKGTTIHIVVSMGKEPVVKTMENLVNQREATAYNYLRGQGMDPFCEYVYDAEIEEGYVIRTDPVEGTVLTEGQVVRLYISKGPESKDGTMPKVEGQTLETARTILKNQKLDLDIKEVEENSDTVEEGRIIRSEPAFGEMIKTGDTVTLYVSKGPEKAKMPKVEGEDLQTALKVLEAAGFKNVVYDEYVESELPKDTVVEQSVKAGEEVPINEKIVLKLSKGKEVIAMPNVVGKDVREALDILTKAGFKNIVYTEYVKSDLPKGAVAKQSVPEGKEILSTDFIELKISGIAMEVEFTLMDDSVEAFDVEIIRMDINKQEYKAKINEPVIKLELLGIGTVTYKVTMDGNKTYTVTVNFDKQEVTYNYP